MSIFGALLENAGYDFNGSVDVSGYKYLANIPAMESTANTPEALLEATVDTYQELSSIAKGGIFLEAKEISDFIIAVESANENQVMVMKKESEQKMDQKEDSVSKENENVIKKFFAKIMAIMKNIYNKVMKQFGGAKKYVESNESLIRENAIGHKFNGYEWSTTQKFNNDVILPLLQLANKPPAKLEGEGSLHDRILKAAGVSYTAKEARQHLVDTFRGKEKKEQTMDNSKLSHMFDVVKKFDDFKKHHAETEKKAKQSFNEILKEMKNVRKESKGDAKAEQNAKVRTFTAVQNLIITLYNIQTSLYQQQFQEYVSILSAIAKKAAKGGSKKEKNEETATESVFFDDQLIAFMEAEEIESEDDFEDDEGTENTDEDDDISNDDGNENTDDDFDDKPGSDLPSDIAEESTEMDKLLQNVRGILG